MRVSSDYTSDYTKPGVRHPLRHLTTPTTPMNTKPERPPGFPLFAHANGQWAKKVRGKLTYYGPWSDPDAALERFQGRIETQNVASEVRQGKPSKDFPLFLHASGQWARKVRGKTVYFGTDRDEAAKRWAEQKDDLLGGRGRRIDLPTVRDLVNRFVTAKKVKVDTGEIAQRSWDDYDQICGRIVAVFGAATPLESLGPEDFGRLRVSLSKGKTKKLGHTALANMIGRARVVFNFAKHKPIGTVVAFGESFSKPSRAALRKERQKRPKKLFKAEEIRALLIEASPQVKAMILLGINCGLGNADVARLTYDKFHGTWLEFPRPKTGIDRRCPLWPETLEALEVVAAERPKPKNAEHDDRVFITKYGTTWEPKSIRDSPISNEIAKLTKTLGIKRQGVGFYALRHGVQTIGQQKLDKDAVRYILGHVEDQNDMSAVYSEDRPSDERLKAVTDHVREWLYKEAPVAENADAT